MKISLTQDKDKDIQILTVTGEIDVSNIQVLKAGVTKLYRNGHNKLILEIPHSDKLGLDVLREIAVLNQLARDLSGNLVLSGVTSDTKAKIESLSKPPVVGCFADRAAAIASFTVAAKERDEKSFGIPSDILKLLADRKKETEELKEQLKFKETRELGLLKEDNERLKNENRLLVQKLETILPVRRVPFDKRGFESKIGDLEKQVLELVNQIRATAR